MKIELDGMRINSEKEFHKAIADALKLPGYYGHNLDALNDVLSADVERPVVLTWNHASQSKALMGSDFDKIVAVLRRVEAQDVEWGLEEKFELVLS